TGATGGFQFLEGTAKQYGVKDRYDLAQSAEGAGKYMSYLLKLFKGDLEKAVRAYHAGEGNVQKGKGIGKNNNQYWKDFMGYVAGANGYSAGDISSKDFDKLLQDTTNLAKEQAKIRLQLENDVANEVTKIRNDLAKKLEDVDKANFTPERKAEITAQLKARADNDIAIAQQALRTKLDDYKQFNMTEEQLLKDSFDRKKFNAAHDIELSKEQRDEAIKYLDQQYQHELGLMQLAQEQRLFQTQQSYMHEVEAMRERYRLEREEISKTVRDPKQRSKLLNASARAEDNEFADKRKGTWDNYRRMQGEMDGTSEYVNLDIDYEGQAKVLEDARKYELISADEHEAALLKIKQDYKDKKLALDLAYGQQAIGSLTSMFGSMFGEQSKAYKIMFAADKAYAIAVAGIEIQKGISKAMGLGFPANIPVLAQVAAQGATILSNIRAIADVGFATGGYTGNMGRGDVAGVVHGQEYVLNAAATKRVGVDTLNAINSGQSLEKASSSQPIVNIYNLPGQTAEVTQNNDGSLDVRIRQIAGEVAEQVFLQGIQNPNSRISKAFKQNYNATPRRQ
ncbi:lytic transglycosylase domain-containing protein, partial [Acinetobacter baumannii]|uniref:lytic transglycosylase domain-containing protein n=1 Tax=Acinetobacter baumannii TaxID=470 RepID=UPI001FF66BA9